MSTVGESYHPVFLSFDLWNTLLLPNPDFSMERASYLYSRDFGAGRSISEINAEVKRISTVCNAVNESGVGHISSSQMYAMLLHYLLPDEETIDESKINSLKVPIEDLFMKYPPLFPDYELLCTEIADWLINEVKPPSVIAVVSNTGWMDGFVMKKMLKKIYPKFEKLVTFYAFSDEQNCAKPSKEIIREPLSNIRKLYFENPLDEFNDDAVKIILNKFTHFGDSKYADGKFCENTGMRFQKVINANIFKEVRTHLENIDKQTKKSPFSFEDMDKIKPENFQGCPKP